jgi:hypothetical protein
VQPVQTKSAANWTTILLPMNLTAVFGVAVSLIIDDSNWRVPSLIIGAINLVSTIAVFVYHGGTRVTPLGLFSLPFGMFSGMALLLGSFLGERVDGWTFGAIATLHLSFLVIVVLCWKVLAIEVVKIQFPERWFKIWLVVFILSMLLKLGGTVFGPLPAALALAGISGITLGASHSASHGGPKVPLLTIPISFVVFILYFFEKNGRLQIATIGSVVLLSISSAWPNRQFKKSVLFAIPVFLLWSGLLRGDHSTDVLGGGSRAAVVADGLSSAYSPFFDYVLMVRADFTPNEVRFPRQYGRTFVTSTTAWVPRSLWRAKPKGFGSELAWVFRPQYAPAGHSIAVLALGEWYANFGFVGAGFFVGSAVWSIRRLQRWQEKNSNRHKAFFSYHIFVILTCSAGDYLWVGTFTVMARTGLAAAAVFVISLTFRNAREKALLLAPDTFGQIPNRRRSYETSTLRPTTKPERTK